MKTRTLSISKSGGKTNPGILDNLWREHKSPFNMQCGDLRNLMGARKGKKVWEKNIGLKAGL